MTDNLTPNTTPQAGGEANPVTEPNPTEKGTVQPNSEANGQGASIEEGFTKVNPETLPPQLKEAYNNMLRDYKEKTTKLSDRVKSETEKAIASYKQKADFYDAFTQNEELVKYYNDYVNKANNPNNNQVNPLEEKVKNIETELQIEKTAKFIDAFADAKDEKGNLLHPDFDKYESISLGKHQKAGDYNLLRATVELASGATPQERLENGYKTAKAVYDSIFEEGRKAGMGRVQQKVKNGSLPPSSSPANGTAPHKPKNALEALEFARKGLVPIKD